MSATMNSGDLLVLKHGAMFAGSRLLATRSEGALWPDTV